MSRSINTSESFKQNLDDYQYALCKSNPTHIKEFSPTRDLLNMASVDREHSSVQLFNLSKRSWVATENRQGFTISFLGGKPAEKE